MTTITPGSYSIQVSLAGVGPQGPAGPQGPSGYPSVGKIVTTSYSMTSLDGIVETNQGAAISILLPASPILWTPYSVKDGSMNCSNWPVTLTGTIDNVVNPVMNQDGMSKSFYNNGTSWRFI